MRVLIVVIVILGIAVFTNPSKKDHIEAVKDLLAEKINESMINSITDSKNNFEAAGAALGATLGMSFLNNFLDNMVFRKNYIVFSLTEIRLGGQSKIIGIGAFGSVWIGKSTDDLNLDH